MKSLKDVGGSILASVHISMFRSGQQVCQCEVAEPLVSESFCVFTLSCVVCYASEIKLLTYPKPSEKIIWKITD